jgi:hypothetical protein
MMCVGVLGTPFMCLCRFSDLSLGWWLRFDQCKGLRGFLLNKEKVVVYASISKKNLEIFGDFKIYLVFKQKKIWFGFVNKFRKKKLTREPLPK